MREPTPLAAYLPPFEVHLPARQSLPVVLNSPHSGSIYPKAFLELSQLDAITLRRSEDSFTDELFAPLVPKGCPMLKARFPRAFLDVNREPFELDPAMFDGPLPDYVNHGSLRVAGGLGTVPRIVSEHVEIYNTPLQWSEVETRIDQLYFPYHTRLRELVEQTRERFGWALLIDCHSMPSMAAGPAGRDRPDIILGDRYGCACSPAMTMALDAAFTAQGLKVARNKPYAGGYITQAYSQPIRDIHAVQIEINRGLYMDERTFARARGFTRVRRMIDAALTEFFGQLAGFAAPVSMAAE